MSTIKVDTVRPVTADASLTLQGDNSGTGVSGITIDSSGNTALGGVLKLKSSGNSITASNGTTSIFSESSGTVTVDNAIVGNDYTGILEVDQWYLTANKGNADPVIDWSRNNFNTFSKIGTGLSETSSNSGIFKFPRNGLYEIIYHAMFRHVDTDDHTVELDLQINPDNSSFTSVARITEGLVASTHNGSASNTFFANVTNNSVFQFKFVTNSLSGSNVLSGQTSAMQTNFVIKRLGPAQ